MPLASWYALHFHGPGLGSAIGVSSATASASLTGRGRMAAVNTTAPTGSARINEGRQMRAVNVTAPTASATLKGRGRMTAVGTIGVLSQDDVTGAVLQAPLEGGLTVAGALRVLLAVAAGKTSIAVGPPVVVAFRDRADTKDRVRAQMDDSERDAVTIDGSA